MWSRLFGARSSSSAPQSPSFSVASLSQLHSKLLEQHTLGAVASPVVTVEAIRQIGEVLVYGDQRRDEERGGFGGGGSASGASERYLEVFCELGVLRTIVDLYRDANAYNLPGVAAQVLQTVSIILLNAARSSTLFFLLSNNHINDLIEAPLDESDEEAVGFYVSLLKTLSLAFGTGAADTLQFFFLANAPRRRGDGSATAPLAADRFPLFTAALHFSAASDGMVRTTTRQIVLNCFRARDAGVRKFLCGLPVMDAFGSCLETTLLQILNDVDSILCDFSNDRGNVHRLDGAWSELVDEMLYWGDVLALAESEECECGSETLSTLRPLTDFLQARLLRGKVGELLMRSVRKLEPSDSAARAPKLVAAFAYRVWSLITCALAPSCSSLAEALVASLVELQDEDNKRYSNSVLDAALEATGSREDASRTARCASECITALATLGDVYKSRNDVRSERVRLKLTEYGIWRSDKADSAENEPPTLKVADAAAAANPPHPASSFIGVAKDAGALPTGRLDIDFVDTGARPSGPRPVGPIRSTSAAPLSPTSTPSSPTASPSRRARAATSSDALSGVSKMGKHNAPRPRAESNDATAASAVTPRLAFWDKPPPGRHTSTGTVGRSPARSLLFPETSLAERARAVEIEHALIRSLASSPPPKPGAVDALIQSIMFLRTGGGGARVTLSESAIEIARAGLEVAIKALAERMRAAARGDHGDGAALPVIIGVDAAADVDSRASYTLALLASAGAAQDGGVDFGASSSPLPVAPEEANIARAARVALASLAALGANSSGIGAIRAAVEASSLLHPASTDEPKDGVAHAAAAAYEAMRQICALRAVVRASSGSCLSTLRRVAASGVAPRGFVSDDLGLGEWASDDLRVREFVCPLDAIAPGNTFSLAALTVVPATLWPLCMKELPSPLGSGAPDGGAAALSALVDRVRDGSVVSRRVVLVLGKTFLVIAEPLPLRPAAPPPAPAPRPRARALAVVSLHLSFVSPVPAAGMQGAASIVDVRCVARGWAEVAGPPAPPVLVPPADFLGAPRGGGAAAVQQCAPPPGRSTPAADRILWRPSPRILGCTVALESVEAAANVVAHVDAARTRVLRARTASMERLKGGLQDGEES